MVHIHLLEFFHPASYQSTGCGQLIVGKLCLAKVTETSGSPTAQRPRPFTWSWNYSAGSPGLPLVSQRPLIQLPWNSTFLFPNPQSSHFQSAVCQSCFPRKLLHSRVPAWYCKTILRIQSSLQSVFPREALVSLASSICSLLNICIYPFPTCLPGSFSIFSLPLSLNLAGS